MTSRTLALTLRQLLRRSLVLLVVAALAVPVVRAANRLALNVDGDVLHVLSFDDTVGEVVASEGVELAAGDELLPTADTPVSEVSSITVLRTIEVDLVQDGATTTHRGTWRTVQGLLSDVGVTVADTQVLRPSPRTALEDGDTVEVASPAIVAVTVDGETTQVPTHLATVGELLELTGTTVGERDRLSPDADTGLTDGLEVTLERVALEDETEEVPLPFDEETRETDELFTDESRVAQQGEEGLRVDSYRVTVVDGERTGRELVSEEVVREPVPRIVEQGTAERPPPEPEPEPEPEQAPAPPPSNSGSSSSGDGVWYDLAQCESGQRWGLDSTYDGGLQFHPDTWSRNKPSGYPQYAYEASAAQQIEVGRIIQSQRGWGAWPHCSAELGLR